MKKKKILLVDDEKLICESLAAAVSVNSSLDLKVASTGMKGLELVNSFKPDLVLLDILMPVMSGIEFMRELKKDADTAEIKVLVVTNLDLNSDEVKQCLKEFDCEIMVKSDSSVKDIVTKINSMLG